MNDLKILGEPYTETYPQHQGVWHAFNSGGVECEVGEFLYGLVRLIKPSRILETGTHKGISSSYMGLALKENERGHLDTIEFDPQHFADARGLWRDLDIQKFITQHEIKVEDFMPQTGYDLLFLDSEPEIRFGELKRFWPYLNDGGYAFIHDLHNGMSQNVHNPDHPDTDPWPFGPFPEEMKGITRFHFPNPRGLTGFYKPTKEDFK